VVGRGWLWGKSRKRGCGTQDQGCGTHSAMAADRLGGTDLRQVPGGQEQPVGPGQHLTAWKGLHVVELTKPS
jgi:hypothetical protein